MTDLYLKFKKHTGLPILIAHRPLYISDVEFTCKYISQLLYLNQKNSQVTVPHKATLRGPLLI